MRRLPSRLLGLLIAASVVVPAACGSGQEALPAPTPTEIAPAATPTLPGETPEAPTATPEGTPEAPTATTAPTPSPTPGPIEPADAPWEEPGRLLPVDSVPAFLVETWRSGSSSGCPLVYPDDVEAIDDEAVVRQADFPGWGVAWDRPDGPGRSAGGEYCEDCGRSTFGVALLGAETALDNAPERLEGLQVWDDGSRVGWFHEGFVEPTEGVPVIGHLEIPRYACAYQLWSFAGEEQLLELVDRLRYVLLPAPGATDPPPWAADRLAADTLDRVYLQEWAEAGEPDTCPFLAFADLGTEASGAVARRATNEGESLVAWDLPDGPGHDASGEPCPNCGRGVIGLGTFQGTSAVVGEPATHIWSDGSVASVAEGLYGTEARLKPEGYDCTYWLWSHLGPDQLDYLISQLRLVQR